MQPALHKTRDRVVRRLLSRVVVAACYLTIALGALSAQADDPQLKNEIRAAFIYNIARFINWPEGALIPQTTHIQFCLYRSNLLGSAVATIEGKPLHQLSVQVSTIEDLAAAAHCHALLIPGQELETFQTQAASHPTSALTITDLSSGKHRHRAHQGIMVTLIRKGANLGFEINLGAMQRGGFRASSELLKLAVIVVEEAP